MKPSLNIKIYLILLATVSILLTGCSSGGDNNELNINSYNSNLSNFSFYKEQNPELSVNAKSISHLDKIFITVPEDVDLSSLVPSFNVAEGATVTMNNQPVESGKTSVDFSKTVEIRVTAANGNSSIYLLLAKNGNATVDNKVYSFMIKHSIPGVSVAISKDEETVYAAGYGFAVEESKERVTPNTLFRLASMSKQQTALAIMTLYERGLLTIDDRVFGEGGILEKEFGTNVLPQVKTITVKHLLSHTSGWSSDPIYTSRTDALEDRIKEYITQVSPTYAPGEVFDYNNLGFCILGKIVETLSGKDYETFLKEEVHAKAGISNIFVGKNTLGERRANECKYYGQDGKNPYGNDVEMSKAAGGMIASTAELMKLMTYIDYGTKVPDIFKKETLDLMYKPVDSKTSSGNTWNRYALGWRVNYPDITSWEAYHGGTLAGVCTIWARNKRNVNGVVLCNSRSYNMSIDDDMWFMLEEIQEIF